MNILILTASNPMKSAGIVAHNFFMKYSAIEDNDVRMIVGEYGVFDNNKIIAVQSRFEKLILRTCKRLAIILGRFLKTERLKKYKTNENYYFLDFDITTQFYSTERILKGVDFKPDLVVIFFMQGFLTFKNISEIYQLTRAKLALYMMDMSPMTGGCHYSWGCNGYVFNCDNCPAILSESFSNQARANLASMIKYVKNIDLTVVAASEFQFGQLRSAKVFENHRKGKVLIGVDPMRFNIGSKTVVREKLKLPTNAKIIFFGAVTPNVKRKGFKELIGALNHLKHLVLDNEVHLAIAGVIDDRYLATIPFNFTSFGNVSFPVLAELYRSADLFMCPSLEDSGPMMINQAIMSGLPTVSFNVGVALDLIINGKTGYRVEIGDVKAMAMEVAKIINLDSMEYDKLVQNCRDLGLANLTVDGQFVRFNDLINEKNGSN